MGAGQFHTQLLQGVFESFNGLDADKGTDLFSAFENEQGGNGHDAKAGGQLWLVIHVDFPDVGACGGQIGEMVINEFTLHAAGGAPRRPEIDNPGALRNGLVESGGGEVDKFL